MGDLIHSGRFSFPAAEGLIDRLPGAKGHHASRVAARIEIVLADGNSAAGPMGIAANSSSSPKISFIAPPE